MLAVALDPCMLSAASVRSAINIDDVHWDGSVLEIGDFSARINVVRASDHSQDQKAHDSAEDTDRRIQLSLDKEIANRTNTKWCSRDFAVWTLPNHSYDQTSTKLPAHPLPVEPPCTRRQSCLFHEFPLSSPLRNSH